MLQAPKRVILIRNESLHLTCNTTNVNGNINLKWVTPLGSVRPFYLLLSVCCPVGWTVEVENGVKSELVCSQCRFCMAYKRLFVWLNFEGSRLKLQDLACVCGCVCLCASACVSVCVLWTQAVLSVSVFLCLARIDMQTGLISRDLWALTGCRLVSTATSKGCRLFSYPDGELHPRAQCHVAHRGGTDSRHWEVPVWSGERERFQHTVGVAGCLRWVHLEAACSLMHPAHNRNSGCWFVAETSNRLVDGNGNSQNTQTSTTTEHCDIIFICCRNTSKNGVN